MLRLKRRLFENGAEIGDDQQVEGKAAQRIINPCSLPSDLFRISALPHFLASAMTNDYLLIIYRAIQERSLHIEQLENVAKDCR